MGVTDRQACCWLPLTAAFCRLAALEARSVTEQNPLQATIKVDLQMLRCPINVSLWDMWGLPEDRDLRQINLGSSQCRRMTRQLLSVAKWNNKVS